MSAAEIYYASEWIIRIVMLLVVIRRKHGPSAMSWLMVIFFLPWPGMLLYLMFGEVWLANRRFKQLAQWRERMRVIGETFEDHPHMVSPVLPEGGAVAAQIAEKLCDMPILEGNSLEYLPATEGFIDRLVEDINAAQQHVHLLYFIFVDDKIGRRVADALKRAAERGVTCRVLADAAGSRKLFKRLGPEMVRNGVLLHNMLPLGFFRSGVSRIDLRNHRKLAVIDSRVAYTGSHNIVEPSYGHKNLEWHDLSARVCGPVVLELQAVFASDWFYEAEVMLDEDNVFPDPQRCGDIPIQTLPSGPIYKTANYQRMALVAIHAAQKRIVITTPYFVPDDALVQGLQLAVLRGVQVDLVVPEKGDKVLLDAVAGSYYEELLNAGIHIHHYTTGLLHAKTLTVDDSAALFGTSNFDSRSFEINFELSLILYGAEVTVPLREQQDAYIQNSRRLTVEEWSHRGSGERLLQGIAQLLAPLL